MTNNYLSQFSYRFRGQGLAKKLMNESENIAIENGFQVRAVFSSVLNSLKNSYISRL